MIVFTSDSIWQAAASKDNLDLDWYSIGTEGGLLICGHCV